MNKDILVCGVGGQGTVLASKLIASAYMAKGETVHSAETIGMAQRGGSVTSHVRIGEAYSPLIAQGGADIILAFEFILQITIAGIFYFKSFSDSRGSC